MVGAERAGDVSMGGKPLNNAYDHEGITNNEIE